jgi:predicted ATPase
MQGWGLVEQGRVAEGIVQIHRGIKAWRATGAELALPHWLALLAEAYGRAKQAEEGLSVIREALALVERKGEHYYEAELYRLMGELLLQQHVPGDQQAETCFRRALDVSRRQQAKSWELRAAMSLSQLWQRQHQDDAARNLLTQSYSWFTEGLHTRELQQAKALLKELS